MQITIAIYHSNDPSNEEYFDVAKVEKQYGIRLWETNNFDWGGESIFRAAGTKAKLDDFAQNYCFADRIEDLMPVIKA